jgi:uncharacterized membrane protein
MSDALGTLLVLSGCFLAASGYVLQKKGNMAWSAEPAVLRKPIYCNRLWLGGLVCMVASALLVVASAPFLDQSKSAPLGAATLVFNTLFSTLFLGEKFLVLHLISTLLIVVGAVLSAGANTAPSADLTYPQILSLFDAIATAFSVLCALLVGASVLVLRRISRQPRAQWSSADATTLSLLAPALGGAANGFVSYATKVVTTALGKGDAGAFASPAFWAFLALQVAAVLGQVNFLNLGLAYSSAMQIVPVFQCAIIFSNSVCGIVYFHDMRANPGALGVFFTGAAICGAGILLLLLNKDKAKVEGEGRGSSAETLIEPPAGAAAGAAAGSAEGGALATAPPAVGSADSSSSSTSTTSSDSLEAARALSAQKYTGVWPEPVGDTAGLTQGEGEGQEEAAHKPWYLREVRTLIARRR